MISREGDGVGGGRANGLAGVRAVDMRMGEGRKGSKDRGGETIRRV